VSIIASCGHEIDELWRDNDQGRIVYEGETRKCEPCEVWACVCRDCLGWYMQEMDAQEIIQEPCSS
jgi:hypothetical protein